MLGHTAANLNGQRFCSIIEKSHQDVYYHLKRRILSSLQADSCELQIKRSDGSCIWVQLSVTIAAVDTSSSGLRISVLNIDSRIRAEAAKALLENQLRESQKMEAVGTLASGIAHDFNNILTVIVINADVANRLITDAAPGAVLPIKEIQKATARARELVRQILAFCRRQPTGLRTISLKEVIEESVGLLRPLCRLVLRCSFLAIKAFRKYLPIAHRSNKWSSIWLLTLCKRWTVRLVVCRFISTR